MKKILVVDGDESNLKNAVEAITELGYEVITASSGEEAKKIIEDVSVTEDIFMVLLDIDLETKSAGDEVMRAAREKCIMCAFVVSFLQSSSGPEFSLCYYPSFSEGETDGFIMAKYLGQEKTKGLWQGFIRVFLDYWNEEMRKGAFGIVDFVDYMFKIRKEYRKQKGKVMSRQDRDGFHPGFLPERVIGVGIMSESKKMKKILVVDDNESELKNAVEAMIELGYEVITASSGEEAKKIIEDVSVTEDIFMVLSDMNMEKEDAGTDVMRATDEKCIPCVIVASELDHSGRPVFNLSQSICYEEYKEYNRLGIFLGQEKTKDLWKMFVGAFLNFWNKEVGSSFDVVDFTYYLFGIRKEYRRLKGEAMSKQTMTKLEPGFLPERITVGGKKSESKKMKKILVVDDNESELKNAVEAMIELGYEVITASSGEEAKKIIEDVSVTEDIFMVLSDMNMETETAGIGVLMVAKEKCIPCVIVASRLDHSGRPVLNLSQYICFQECADFISLRTFLEQEKTKNLWKGFIGAFFDYWKKMSRDFGLVDVIEYEFEVRKDYRRQKGEAMSRQASLEFKPSFIPKRISVKRDKGKIEGN